MLRLQKIIKKIINYAINNLIIITRNNSIKYKLIRIKLLINRTN